MIDPDESAREPVNYQENEHADFDEKYDADNEMGKQKQTYEEDQDLAKNMAHLNAIREDSNEDLKDKPATAAMNDSVDTARVNGDVYSPTGTQTAFTPFQQIPEQESIEEIGSPQIGNHLVEKSVEHPDVDLMTPVNDKAVKNENEDV